MYCFWKGLSTQDVTRVFSYDDGFKFKLVRYCAIKPLAELSDAIIHTVNLQAS